MTARYTAVLTATALFLVAVCAPAQEPAPSDKALAKGFAQQRAYSPYAERNFPTRVLWGDTHLHTALSFDAGAFGARLLPTTRTALQKANRSFPPPASRQNFPVPWTFW